MDTRTILEIVGWAGSGLVVISLVVASQRAFRGLNLAGSLIATAYNAILGVWPAVGMNTAIALIDIYWLLRLRRDSRPRSISDDS
ncbi:YgjV family protein [Actinomyces procaprae]|uniref:YgjV family protein n=1 Tax=Actinomyces procaprae TaxID=2560010 RepID=UPI00109E2F43|nr:YgjV family protein [Actinomyces procaprae]